MTPNQHAGDLSAGGRVQEPGKPPFTQKIITIPMMAAQALSFLA
jgi:hypothetical protein